MEVEVRLPVQIITSSSGLTLQSIHHMISCYLREMTFKITDCFAGRGS